jgi:hypothetical protein
MNTISRFFKICVIALSVYSSAYGMRDFSASVADSIKETFGDTSLFGASAVAVLAHEFDWGSQYLKPTLAIGWTGTFARKLLRKDSTYNNFWKPVQLIFDCPMAFGYLATKVWYDGYNNIFNDIVPVTAVLGYIGVRAFCKLNRNGVDLEFGKVHEAGKFKK